MAFAPRLKGGNRAPEEIGSQSLNTPVEILVQYWINWIDSFLNPQEFRVFEDYSSIHCMSSVKGNLDAILLYFRVTEF